MVKNSVEELAILGGTPAFDEPLLPGRPNVGNREHLLARINDTLDRGSLTNNGPYVQEFERKISELLGVKHCIAVCNATVALSIGARAAGLTGEVIIPSWTFIATAHAFQWLGITPVLCDVDPVTHNIDPSCVEEMITARTTGIVGVHLWGRPCDVDALANIAERHSLKLLMDAAHAFGCSHQGRMIGNFGDAEVFSFHATKFLNTLEGGAVTTNDDHLAAKLRSMRNFGLVGYDGVSFGTSDNANGKINDISVSYLGTNGKMNDISAAMGLTSLESMDEFLALNRRNYERYAEELRGLPGVYLLPYDDINKHNYHYVVLELDPSAAQLSRDELMQILWAENVKVRRWWSPGCHRAEPYCARYPRAELMFPVTEKLLKTVLALPTGMAITPDDVTTVCSIIRTAVSQGPAIRRRLSGLESKLATK